METFILRLFLSKFVNCPDSHSRNKAKNASFSVNRNRLDDDAKIRIIFDSSKFFSRGWRNRGEYYRSRKT